MKTAEQTARTTVKTTEQAAKNAYRAAKASRKAAEKSAKTAGKATEKTVKAVAKTTVSVAKAIIAGTKALLTAIAAGGWIAILVLIVVLLFGAALSMTGGDNSSTVSPISAEVQVYEPSHPEICKTIWDRGICGVNQGGHDAGVRRAGE